jgi:hypothetical protein
VEGGAAGSTNIGKYYRLYGRTIIIQRHIELVENAPLSKPKISNDVI